MMGNYAATHTVVLEAVGFADYPATVQKRRSVPSQWIMVITGMRTEYFCYLFFLAVEGGIGIPSGAE
jgi:hypothetical protein